MGARSHAVASWPWITVTTHFDHAGKSGQQELWAGAVYLVVWSVLWLAVIVTVLAPLEGFFGGAR